MYHEIKNTLTDLIKNCYQDLPLEKINNYIRFYIKLENRTLKSYLGKYKPKKRTIYLYNIKNESNTSVIVTLLHELAHHIDHMNRNKSNHDNYFYNIHIELLCTAFDMKIITYEEFMIHSSKAQNIAKLKRMIEKINYPSIAKDLDYKKDYLWLIASNQNNHKTDDLKSMGFKYNPYIRKWCLRCHTSKADTIDNQLYDYSVIKIRGSTLIFNLDSESDKFIIKQNPEQSLNNIGICPNCGSKLIERTGKYGKFIACSNYPKCKYIQKTVTFTNNICPKCGSKLILKKGKYGYFEGCSNYPECKYIKPKKTSNINEKCPICGKILVTRESKYGSFIACSGYPDCKYIKKGSGNSNEDSNN